MESRDVRLQDEERDQTAPEPLPNQPEEDARELMHQLFAIIENLVELNPNVPSEVLQYVRGIQQPGLLADHAAFSPECSFEERLRILETLDQIERVRVATEIMRRHLEMAQVRSKIREDVKAGVDKAQREFFLREQLRAIQRELGESEGDAAISDELREKIEAAGMPEAAKEKALKELNRLKIVGMHSPEQGVINTYLEWLTELPWAVATEDHLDIKDAA